MQQETATFCNLWLQPVANCCNLKLHPKIATCCNQKLQADAICCNLKLHEINAKAFVDTLAKSIAKIIVETESDADGLSYCCNFAYYLIISKLFLISRSWIFFKSCFCWILIWNECRSFHSICKTATLHNSKTVTTLLQQTLLRQGHSRK